MTEDYSRARERLAAIVAHKDDTRRTLAAQPPAEKLKMALALSQNIATLRNAASTRPPERTLTCFVSVATTGPTRVAREASHVGIGGVPLAARVCSGPRVVVTSSMQPHMKLSGGARSLTVTVGADPRPRRG